MPSTLRLMLLSAAMGAASPAAAQEDEIPGLVLHVDAGGAWANAALYCGEGTAVGCGAASSPVTYSAWLAGAAIDLHLRGAANLTLGGRVLAPSSFSDHPAILEPVAGVTWKLPPTSQLQTRFAVGGAALLATSGRGGAVVRFGGGASLSPRSPVGLGADVTFEVGSYRGNLIYLVQVSAGAELRL